MASVGTARNSYWKTTNPIPSDPVYDKFSSSQTHTKVKLNNPIPKDPVYSSPRERRAYTPKPRVKPEALAIARNHQGRDLAFLFNPSFQVIPIGVRPTHQETRDYGKENYQKIKQIQRANKERQGESARQTPVKAVYKPNKFDHVQSKVAERIQTPIAPRPSSAKIQRSQSMFDLNKSSKTLTNTITSENIKKTRPSSARVSSKDTNNKDIEKNRRPVTATQNARPKSHIVLNKQSLKNVKLKRSPSLSALDDLKNKQEKDFNKHKRGSVPKYLQERQQQWKVAEKERIASLPDPTIPEGHSLMPEDDRLKTFNMLKKSKHEMTKELQSLPFGKDTMRVKNRKDTLERKLQEVDAAMKIFSRPKVFIKDE